MAKTKQKPESEFPVITSYSMVRGKDGWSAVTIVVQADKVLSVEATPADTKAIAQEKFKILVAKNLFSQG